MQAGNRNAPPLPTISYKKEPIVALYEQVLKGEVKNFPKGTWAGKEGQKRARILTRYLLEEKMGWTLEEIKEKASVQLFKEHQLKGLMKSVFQEHLYLALNNAYPGRFKPWEFRSKLTAALWKKKETRVEAVRWLFEEKLGWTLEYVKKNINKGVFKQNGLGPLLEEGYKNDLHAAVDEAYPGKIKRWELPSVEMAYWENPENRRAALRWLAEEKTPPQETLNAKMVRKHGLYKMLLTYYQGNIEKALAFAYEGQEQPPRANPLEEAERHEKAPAEPFSFAPQEMPDPDKMGGDGHEVAGSTGKQWQPRVESGNPLKALLSAQLGWSLEMIKEQVSFPLLREHQLEEWLMETYGGSLYLALHDLYPHQVQPWELKKVFEGHWESAHQRRRALRWLFEQKIGCGNAQPPASSDKQIAHRHGLQSLLDQQFEGNLERAWQFAYPSEEAAPPVAWSNDQATNKAEKNSAPALPAEAPRQEISSEERVRRLKKQPWVRKEAPVPSAESEEIRAIIDMYAKSLKGKGQTISANLWKRPNARQIARALTRYLLEEKIGWKQSDIPLRATERTFSQFKLGRMLSDVFGGSAKHAIRNAYGEEIYEQAAVASRER